MVKPGGTNKVLESILKKIINSNCTNWDVKLSTTLWAYRNFYNTSIKPTLFELVYGLWSLLPFECLVPFYHMGCDLNSS
jgi:hypothetical protein